jgi:hypothetical protein
VAALLAVTLRTISEWTKNRRALEKFDHDAPRAIEMIADHIRERYRIPRTL